MLFVFWEFYFFLGSRVLLRAINMVKFYVEWKMKKVACVQLDFTTLVFFVSLYVSVRIG